MSRVSQPKGSGAQQRKKSIKKSGVGSVSFDDGGAIRTINQYNIIRPLGKGSFAEVFLCCDKSTKDQYAVKIFNKSLLRRKRTMERTANGVHVHSELEKVEREIAIMKRLVHPNLVCLYEVIDDNDDDQLYMFMEYVEIGPVMTYDKLTHVFKSRVTGGLCSEPSAAQYLLDIAAGLRFLHANHIAHRDLKPDNVLLSITGHIKIADFGVAHFFDTDRQKSLQSVRHLERSQSRAQMMETQGTYCFWAPEMIEVERSFNAFACDMWAAGVCFYIFLSGELPFYDEAVTGLFDKIRAAEPTMPENLCADARRVIASLLNTDVTKRMTVHDLEIDPWLKDLTQNHNPADDVAEIACTINTSNSIESPKPRRLNVNHDLELAFSKLHTKCKGVMNKFYTMTSSGTKRLAIRRKTTM